MLNAMKLSELLAKNVDLQLYPRMFVMSPNGTLLAYSTPVDIKELRDQAALISMTWKEQEATLQTRHARSQRGEQFESEPSAEQPLLETLTIEFAHNNIIVRAIQPKLLLVLVGGVPPGRKSPFKIISEIHGGTRYPPAVKEQEPTNDSEQEVENAFPNQDFSHSGEENSLPKPKTTSIADSHMSQREKDMRLGILHIQRKKLDAMTDFIRKDFDSKGFVMPDDSSFP